MSSRPEIDPPMRALPPQQLVPRIKHVNFRKALQERGLPEEPLPATTPLCGELLVSYAFDLPEQFVMVTPRQLKQAGIVVSEMPALALDNLARSMPEPQQSRLNGCIAIDTGGDLEATLLLLDAFWEQMQASLGGEIVAVVPRRNRLLLCAGNDAQALEQLDRQAPDFFSEEQDARGLSLEKMVRRNGRWQLFGAHWFPPVHGNEAAGVRGVDQLYLGQSGRARAGELCHRFACLLRSPALGLARGIA